MNEQNHPRKEPTTSLIEPRLRDELFVVANRIRSSQHVAIVTTRFLIFAVVLAALIGLQWIIPALSWLTLPVALVSFVVLLVQSARAHRQVALDYREAARLIEQKHPELEHLLSSAAEVPHSKLSLGFLQRRVVDEALSHATRPKWGRVHPNREGPRLYAFLGSALLAFVLVLLLGVDSWQTTQNYARSGRTFEPLILPGDAEAEIGSSVAVTARFEGDLPTELTLSLETADGKREERRMSRSLSDPVFATTLPDIRTDTHYRIRFADWESPTYTVTAFELPRLLRADAFVSYPEYTGLPERRIEDTRRVSAVEGSSLVYEFFSNKPLASAMLTGKEGGRIELVASNDERTAFAVSMTLEHSLRFRLVLEDSAGRQNPFPPEIVIEVRENQPPRLVIDYPRGDQRVSPIEEVRLAATAEDDFGLHDFGLAYSSADGAVQYVSLKQNEEPLLQSSFAQQLYFEEWGLQPMDLVSWFAWAEDVGPDGQLRRSKSDLYFAEIRALDEAFREASGEAPSSQMQSGANQRVDFVQQQKEISIALWRLSQSTALDEKFFEDAKVVSGSQRYLRDQILQAIATVEDPELVPHYEAAEKAMEAVVEEMTTALDSESKEPLEPASMSSQRAYQALLKTLPQDYNVAQSRNQQGGQGQANRNQGQLNQLDFRNEQDRYETASEAQSATSQQEQEELEILAKLSELARRQGDLNQRLQELQTALNQAEDEAEREKIRRELKRLEEEQRELIADVDETRQMMDRPSSASSNQESRRQLDETRDRMQDLTDSLEKEEVSQALASGSKAQNDLEKLKDDFRQQATSQFADDLREARRAAQDLAEEQSRLQSEIEDELEQSHRSLAGDDSQERLAEALDQQKQQVESLREKLKQIAEDSEIAEPLLHKEIYDLLRRSEQDNPAEQLESSSRLFRQGFGEEAKRFMPEIAESIKRLREGVESAAEAALGDEAATLDFAQREIDELAEQVQSERPSEEGKNESGNTATTSGEPGTSEGSRSEGNPSEGSPSQDAPSESQMAGGKQGQQGSPGNPGSQGGPGSPGGSAGQTQQSIEEFLNDFLESSPESRNAGPITGNGFGSWANRLRTVEELVGDDAIRQRLTEAREAAENLREESKRHGSPPQWESIEAKVVVPLNEARVWLRQEYDRLKNPDTLQAIDREPVPEPFQESVKRYYEALSESN